MNNRLNELYDEVKKVEDKIEAYFDSLQHTWQYTVENGKVKFDRLVKKAHRQYKVGLVKYLVSAKLSHILTAPFIYGMIIPLFILDLGLFVYQQVCFRAYGVPLVKRSDYFIVDRHLLGYLNGLEKLNCLYCSYGNGLIAFAREVLARTEQYWCPIKHAITVKDAHSRYQHFSDYGDAENYRQHLQDLRQAFSQRHTEEKSSD